MSTAVPIETPEQRLLRIRRTPVFALTEDEINLLDEPGQLWARNARAHKAKQDACPGHERISTETIEGGRRGDHRGECKHCGFDMSYDSGD